MELKQELESRYSEYKDKYDLPELKLLNHEFEIADAIQHERFVPQHLLRFIRRRIVSILDSWTGYLHGIVMPGQQSMILYEESNSFSEQEKEQVVELMKKIMSLSRLNVILEAEHSEEKDAKFIKDANHKLSELHEELKPFAEKSLRVWENG